MSSARWAVSLLLVLHVTALAVASLLPSEQLPDLDAVRPPVNDPIALRVAPLLDRAVAALSPLSVALWDGTASVRPLSDMYVRVTGLGQRWAMFANPPKADQYLRLRYYIGDARSHPARASLTATELVFPARNEARVRLLQAFRDSYRDKAMAIALQRFHDRVKPAQTDAGEPFTDAAAGTDVQPDDLPDDLAPLARYFSRQFARDRLTGEERIVRTDVWYGAAPNPAPSAERVASAERQIVLGDYYAGPIERPGPVTSYPRYHALEREGDIIWRLEYFEER